MNGGHRNPAQSRARPPLTSDLRMSAFARTPRETPESGEIHTVGCRASPLSKPDTTTRVLAAILVAFLLISPSGCAAQNGGGGGGSGASGTDPAAPARGTGAEARPGQDDRPPSRTDTLAREAGLGRVFLAQGRDAVIPLAPPEGLDPAATASWVPNGPPRVVLENGTELPSRLFRVWGKAIVDGESPARWLPPRVEWRAVEGAGGAAPADLPNAFPAGWVALVEAPTGIPERRLPRFARVDERIVELTWLPPAPQNPDVASGAVPQVSEASLRALGDMLRDDAVNPQRRWRVRLLAQRMGVPALWGDAPPPGFGPTKSRLEGPLEAVAEQLELNARSAVDALRKHDRALALEFLNRLTAVVRTPDGTLLPAWPVGDGRTGEVVIALLAPGASADSRVETARRWLAESSPALAWMIDDIGEISAKPPRTQPSVGVADLGGTGGRAWATTSAAFKGEELDVAVPPSHAVRLRMTMAAGEGSRPVVEAGLTPQGGSAWSSTIAPIVGIAKVTPPGLVLAPMLEPWSLDRWRAREPVPAGAGREMSVTIQRATPGAENESTSGWEAVVRCGAPPAGSVASDDGNRRDTVRLWFGTFERSRGVVTISPGRGAEWVRAADVRIGEGEDERGTRLGGRITRERAGGLAPWTAVVPLPREAFEDDGVTLVIGVERESPAGVRAAFPRPMMPEQPEPGRLAADVSAWGGLPGR